MNPLTESTDAPRTVSTVTGRRDSFPLSPLRCRIILRFSLVLALFATAFNAYGLQRTIIEAQKWFHRPGQAGEPVDILGPIIFGSAGFILLSGFVFQFALVWGAFLVVRASRLGIVLLWMYCALELCWVASVIFAVIWVARDGEAFWSFSSASLVVMFSVLALMALLFIKPHADAL